MIEWVNQNWKVLLLVVYGFMAAVIFLLLWDEMGWSKSLGTALAWPIWVTFLICVSGC